MKAVAVFPGRPGDLRLVDLPAPTLAGIEDGRGVLVRVLQVGLDGTDREIIDGGYGMPPPGDDFLVLGHEGLGIVAEVGHKVTELAVGDLVVPIVRLPGNSVYDRLGMPDMTTDDEYLEHGISRLHGFLMEQFADPPEHLVRVPRSLRGVAVLLEPMSIVEKGVLQAYEIQRRLRSWQPQRAAVLGAGTIGLLATLALRLRGLEVVTLARTPFPYENSDLVEMIGARYVSTRDMDLAGASRTFGPFDLIFEATGFSPLAFAAMEVLAKNGVLVLTSVTGGDRRIQVPADAINLGFVLGNKVMVGSVNANREHFEMGLRDLTMAEALWPGWLARFFTHLIAGLDDLTGIVRALTQKEPQPIKIIVDVAASGEGGQT